MLVLVCVCVPLFSGSLVHAYVHATPLCHGTPSFYPWSFFIGATSSATATLGGRAQFLRPVQTRLCPISRAHVNIHSSEGVVASPRATIPRTLQLHSASRAAFFDPVRLFLLALLAPPRQKCREKHTTSRGNVLAVRSASLASSCFCLNAGFPFKRNALRLILSKFRN